MEYNRSEIANRIFLARKNKGLKQTEICNHLGIAQSTYSDIENGKRDMTLSTLFELCSLLDAKIEWILDLQEDTDYTSEELKLIEDYKKLILKARK